MSRFHNLLVCAEKYYVWTLVVLTLPKNLYCLCPNGFKNYNSMIIKYCWRFKTNLMGRYRFLLKLLQLLFRHRRCLWLSFILMEESFTFRTRHGRSFTIANLNHSNYLLRSSWLLFGLSLEIQIWINHTYFSKQITS